MHCNSMTYCRVCHIVHKYISIKYLSTFSLWETFLTDLLEILKLTVFQSAENNAHWASISLSLSFSLSFSLWCFFLKGQGQAVFLSLSRWMCVFVLKSILGYTLVKKLPLVAKSLLQWTCFALFIDVNICEL